MPPLRQRQESPIVSEYFSHCAETLLNTYPQVRGIGLAAGPDMIGEESVREQWAIDSYLAGAVRAGRPYEFLRCARTPASSS